MRLSRRSLRQHRAAESGFTLVELLVVMIVVGILAAIAVPGAVSQRRKAYETSAKADAKAITNEVMALHVDGTGALTVSGSDGTWELRSSDSTVVASGALSRHNVVSPASHVGADGTFCVSVRNTQVEAQFWTADGLGLRAGDC